MTKRLSSISIQDYILENIDSNPNTISKSVSTKFNISRQSVHRYLNNLIREGLVTAEGNTKNRRYSLKPLVNEWFFLSIDSNLREDVIWRQSLRPLLNSVKNNIIELFQHGFTEMLNNVIDHSGSPSTAIRFTKYTNKLVLCVIDDGMGIFKKICQAFNLDDERHAVLELTKGKLTTDKAHHTGEGIFFTSRMFDRFSIGSGSLYFSHTQGEEEDWLLQDDDKYIKGTIVEMAIGINSSRTVKEVFDKYAATGDDYSFTRTHVPVALVRYGEEQLVSRSQAKRLLARLEPFKEVFLNFEGVDIIGQSFADEIFRVFKNEHPDIKIVWINASNQIENMIKRVTAGLPDDNQMKLNM
jgi:anti-sigma regulatory factor (Ser/Thr protein kinase)